MQPAATRVCTPVHSPTHPASPLLHALGMQSVMPHTTPMAMGAFRLLPAGLLLIAWASAHGRRQPSTPAAWAWVAAFGLVDAAAFQGFLAQGLMHTSAGLGSVIIDSQVGGWAAYACTARGPVLRNHLRAARQDLGQLRVACCEPVPEGPQSPPSTNSGPHGLCSNPSSAVVCCCAEAGGGSTPWGALLCQTCSSRVVAQVSGPQPSPTHACTAPPCSR
jgi:hypothetical protein